MPGIEPIKRTTSDNINFLFNRKTQYKKKRTFKIIKNETPRLTTDSKENVLGGKKGKTKDSKSNTAATPFIK